MPIQPTVLKAPAKLNLTLEVLNKRDDGYHAIRSVMVPVDLADEIRITPSSHFSFTCDRAELGEDNLVVRAFAALGLQSAPVSVNLAKRIPTGAGMGGGSSDAAAVLLAAQAGAFGNVGERDYVNLARSLGSDVPFFLVETGALVEGTGERVTAVGALPQWFAMIVKPRAGVETAQAYRALDAVPRESRPRNTSVSLQMVDALQTRDFDRVVSLLSNDFESVMTAMEPEIRTAADALRKAGAQKPLMTGSGSCVFALARTREECARIAEDLDLSESFERYACAFNDAHAWRAEARS